MKKLTSISMLISVVMLVSFSFVPPSDTLHLIILPQSKVTLKGSSNVNTFTCYNSEVNGSINITYDAQTSSVVESKAKMELNVVGFNCGNDLMENDMQQALNISTNPKIEFSATDGKILDTLKDGNTGDYYKIKVYGNITMAGTTRPSSVIFTGQKTDGYYYLKGTKTIDMTDYGVKPPTAMFGMIRANDTIHLHFDLRLQKH